MRTRILYVLVLAGVAVMALYFFQVRSPVIETPTLTTVETSSERRMEGTTGVVGAPVENKKAVGTADDRTDFTAAYQQGLLEYEQRNFDAAKAAWEPSALAGHAPSQYWLGVIFAVGQGVPQDENAACKWYQKAAERGHSGAQLSLGHYYASGFAHDCKKDDEQAYKWYLRAAEQGNSDAQNWVGLFYENGRYVSRNHEEKIKWYERAAAQGNTYAYNNLGWAHEKGEGVAVDFSEAARYYTLASEDRSHGEALNNLARLYEKGLGVEQDYEKAWDLYSISVDLGNTEGMTRLASLYERGLGIRQNYTKALELYEMASGKNELEAFATDEHNRDEVAGSHADRLKALIEKLNDATTLQIDWGTYYALVIGNDNYQHLENLNTAVNDAQSIAETLDTKYGFRVTTLFDATRSQITKALNGLRTDLTKDDNLLIYYAGHGVEDEVTSAGYWQPVDAEPVDDTNWISLDRIKRTVAAIQSTNVLLIVDSCYSGLVFRGDQGGVSNAVDPVDEYRSLVERKTRIALTSGGDEPVVDAVGNSEHSIFAGSLLKILERNESVLSTTELYTAIRKRVIPVLANNGLDQTPELSEMYESGHDGGEYYFVPRRLR